MRSSVGGVLISGERGTAKSTIVRSFARMMYGGFPVTLPINATDDRVLGGWRINALMQGDPDWQPGLLQQADGRMLYIDEVNLLDDHIINLILDVVSTDVLVVEREGMDDPQIRVSFTLVGTMNPEEGALRPQLLDRFGLFVPASAEQDPDVRRDILLTVLRFDAERDQRDSEWLAEGASRDAERRERITGARDIVHDVEVPDGIVTLCAAVAAEFEVVGHRGEIVMAQGARAAAALDDRYTVTEDDVRGIAQYAIMHRRREAAYAEAIEWSDKDAERLEHVFSGA